MYNYFSDVLFFTQENQSKIYVNQGDFVVDSTLSCNNLWQKSYSNTHETEEMWTSWRLISTLFIKNMIFLLACSVI